MYPYFPIHFPWTAFAFPIVTFPARQTYPTGHYRCYKRATRTSGGLGLRLGRSGSPSRQQNTPLKLTGNQVLSFLEIWIPRNINPLSFPLVPTLSSHPSSTRRLLGPQNSGPLLNLSDTKALGLGCIKDGQMQWTSTRRLSRLKSRSSTPR